jgi:hypothetical protein
VDRKELLDRGREIDRVGLENERFRGEEKDREGRAWGARPTDRNPDLEALAPPDDRIPPPRNEEPADERNWATEGAAVNTMRMNPTTS